MDKKRIEGIQSIVVLRNVIDRKNLSFLTLEELEYLRQWVAAERQKAEFVENELEKEIQQRITSS